MNAIPIVPPILIAAINLVPALFISHTFLFPSIQVPRKPHLRRFAHRLYHFLPTPTTAPSQSVTFATPPPPPPPNPHNTNTHLNHHPPHLLPRLPHPHRHIRQQRRVPDIRRVAVAVDVRGPFVFGGVGVAGPDVARLELLELLLRAEFVGLGWGLEWGGGGRGG